MKSKLDLITFQKKWCLIILNYIIDNIEDSEIIKEQIKIVEEVFNHKNFKGMQFLFNDITQYKDDIGNFHKQELNKILRHSLSVNFTNYETKKWKNIIKILLKGKIENEEEYREILNHIEDIYQVSNSMSEVTMLNNLLIEYENR